MASDFSELNTLAADLTKASLLIGAKAAAAVTKSAVKVKAGARDLSSGLAHAPAYPASIGYDVKVIAGGVDAEIGPDKDKPQGALGNLLEYGSVNNAPLAHLGPALDREGPGFAEALAVIAGQIL